LEGRTISAGQARRKAAAGGGSVQIPLFGFVNQIRQNDFKSLSGI